MPKSDLPVYRLQGADKPVAENDWDQVRERLQKQDLPQIFQYEGIWREGKRVFGERERECGQMNLVRWKP